MDMSFELFPLIESEAIPFLAKSLSLLNIFNTQNSASLTFNINRVISAQNLEILSLTLKVALNHIHCTIRGQIPKYYADPALAWQLSPIIGK